MMKVLLVEDNPHDITFETAMLDGKANVVIAQTIAEALELGRQDFDLALLDLELPDGFSTSFIDTYCNIIPIIVVTGRKESEQALACIRRGAQDYLVKGSFDEEFLWKTIMYAVERFNRLQLQRDRAEFRKKLARLQGIVRDLQDLNIGGQE